MRELGKWVKAPSTTKGIPVIKNGKIEPRKETRDTMPKKWLPEIRKKYNKYMRISIGWDYDLMRSWKYHPELKKLVTKAKEYSDLYDNIDLNILNLQADWKIVSKELMQKRVEAKNKMMEYNKKSEDLFEEIKTYESKTVAEKEKTKPDIKPKDTTGKKKEWIIDKIAGKADQFWDVWLKIFQSEKAAKAFAVLNSLPVWVMPYQDKDGNWRLMVVPRIGRMLSKSKKNIRMDWDKSMSVGKGNKDTSYRIPHQIKEWVPASSLNVDEIIKAHKDRGSW